MQRLYQNLAAFGCVLLLTSPVFAIEALEEEDLDRISASGDPTVIDVEATNGKAVAAYLDDSSYKLSFDVPQAQSGIRALTLMNIVGEAQVLQNLNILSASQNVAGTDQENFSAQSWGSTLPDEKTVKSVKAEAAAPGCLAVYVVYGCAGGPGLFFGGGLKIGDAAAAVDTKITNPASASADVIVRARTTGDEGGDAIVAVNNAGKYELAFDHTEAQKDLATLFFANVVGRAQLALNLNLAAGAVGLIPGSSETFAEPVAAAGFIKQKNTGIQFRGTPLVGSTGTSGQFNTTITN